MSVEPKKVVVTKKTVQEVKESGADDEAVIPAATRTRQNQIIKVNSLESSTQAMYSPLYTGNSSRECHTTLS